MFQYFNPNPRNTRSIGDCTVRALSKTMNISWDKAYIDLAVQGYTLANMPSANETMNSYLLSNGFTRHNISSSCPDCYTVRDFAADHPDGTYLVGTGNHFVAVVDGTYFDTWDSGDEMVLLYYTKEIF